MEQRELVCIGCPLGCRLHVELEDGGVKSVSGNTCPRGREYAIKECTEPERIVTSIVKVFGSVKPTVSVKTSKAVPKNMIFDVMSALKDVKVPSPVSIGDVLVKDVAGTGADIIATKSVA